MSDTLLHSGTTSGAAEDTPSELPAGSWAERHDDPMVLRMVDWRGCAALEYVPGRKGGQATFIGRRIPADTLVDWLTTGGGTLDTFPDAHLIDTEPVRAVYDYMTSGPPVDTVDLTGCPFVELTCVTDVPGVHFVGFTPPPWPTFAGTRRRVEALFDFLKAGRTAREFSDTYDVDYEHVEAVLRHAADQGYQGPLG